MIKAQLFAMGTQRELASTQLMYYRTVNPKTGRSGPIPMGGLVTLAFTSGDGDDRLLRWITHSPEGELCTLTAAKIVFYEGDWDGSTLFEYQLHDAALVHWKEEFKATGTAPMTVTLTISAAIQKIKGVTWIKPWWESRVLSEESAAHKEGVQRGFSDDRGKKEDGNALEGVVLERARGSTQGGLNLFKWGVPQTGENVGWKTGDYMFYLPNKGTPKFNWKVNYGALRIEMGLGKPIFDSYRLPNGNLIPTKGFLNAERSILQGRGWIYNPSKGAWMPPGF